MLWSFANVTRCDILYLMQWHIIFQLWHQIYHFNSTSLSMWNLWSITASNRDTFSFSTLTYSPSSLRCMHVKQTMAGFFETSVKSVCFDKIRFTYEICYLLFVNMKFVLFLSPWQLQNQPSELQSRFSTHTAVQKFSHGQ